jgi:hypothetical protein
VRVHTPNGFGGHSFFKIKALITLQIKMSLYCVLYLKFNKSLPQYGENNTKNREICRKNELKTFFQQIINQEYVYITLEYNRRIKQ